VLVWYFLCDILLVVGVRCWMLRLWVKVCVLFSLLVVSELLIVVVVIMCCGLRVCMVVVRRNVELVLLENVIIIELRLCRCFLRLVRWCSSMWVLS